MVHLLRRSHNQSRNLDPFHLDGKCVLRRLLGSISLTTTLRQQHGTTRDVSVLKSSFTNFRLNIRFAVPSSLDQNVPQYKRDFRRKLIYFRSQPAMRAQPGNCQIKIRRNHIFEDSYAEIMRQTPSDLKKRLMIKFDGEDGLDYGGVSRYVILC